MDTPPLPDALSIGDLARMTGVAVETIRMWERRYGRPTSFRLPSGHRRYSMDEARRLLRVAEAVAHGMRPSAALTATPERIEAHLAAVNPSPPPAAEEWLDLARRFDVEGLAARLRREAAGRSPTEFVSDVVGPLLAAVGRAWADGRIDVRHEHFLSEVVSDELRTLRVATESARDAQGAAAAPPHVLLSTLPGERHALGLDMAAVVAAHGGARCIVLGGDTPIGDIAAAARESEADIVALSVTVAHGGVDADREIVALRALLPPWVRLVAGGAGTRRPRRAPRAIDYVEDFAQFEAVVRAQRTRSAG